MRVQLDGERRPLWVVPTEQGVFCYRLHFHGSCLTSRSAASRPGIGAGGLSTGENGGIDWVVGPVLDPQVHRVELLYQDGERVAVPFVWVSPPLDAGFYAYDVPSEHEETGRLVVAIIGLNEKGERVAHTCWLRSSEDLRLSVPEARELCERRD